MGYRSDGKLLDGSNGLLGTDWAGCSSWGIPGDTVGVGIDITTGEVYCTKNGSFLCSIFKHVFQDYFNVSITQLYFTAESLIVSAAAPSVRKMSRYSPSSPSEGKGA